MRMLILINLFMSLIIGCSDAEESSLHIMNDFLCKKTCVNNNYNEYYYEYTFPSFVTPLRRNCYCKTIIDGTITVTHVPIPEWVKVVPAFENFKSVNKTDIFSLEAEKEE